jgi:hypothetical protein
MIRAGDFANEARTRGTVMTRQAIHEVVIDI